MRKRRFSRPALTQKRFKRCLAALGVLTLWLATLSVLVLPSSHASAERKLDVRTGSPSIHPAKGAGTAYQDSIAEEIVRNSASEITKKFRELCPSWVPHCDLNREPDVETFAAQGSGTSFSTGNFRQDVGGSYQSKVAGDFAAGDPSGRASFAGAFGGFGLSSSAFGFGAFSPAGTIDPVQDFTETLASIENPRSNDPMKSDPVNDEPENDAKEPANSILPSIAGDIDPSNTDNGTGPPTGDSPAAGRPSTPLSIPEPFSLALFAAGLMGAVAARKRRYRKARC
jgi:hypothetical protein